MNDLFASCQHDELADTYACCLRRCGGARICRALCRNVYPGMIPEDCAAFVGCSNSNWVNTQCLHDNQHAFRNCCLKRCRTNEWSDSPAIAGIFQSLPSESVDCVKYCDVAEAILLDQRYGMSGPYTF